MTKSLTSNITRHERERDKVRAKTQFYFRLQRLDLNEEDEKKKAFLPTTKNSSHKIYTHTITNQTTRARGEKKNR